MQVVDTSYERGHKTECFLGSVVKTLACVVDTYMKYI